jgi:hypothetical protein
MKKVSGKVVSLAGQKSALVTALIGHRNRILKFAREKSKAPLPSYYRSSHDGELSLISRLEAVTDEAIASYVEGLSDFTAPTEIGAESILLGIKVKE